MSDREAKSALYDAFASVAGALGSGRRAEIVDVLAQGERSVEEIAGEVGQSVAATSHHLRLLARSGLPICVIQEGGYSLGDLAACSHAFATGLLGGEDQ